MKVTKFKISPLSFLQDIITQFLNYKWYTFDSEKIELSRAGEINEIVSNIAIKLLNPPQIPHFQTFEQFS